MTLFPPRGNFNDSLCHAGDCDATHAFNFDCLIPSNVQVLRAAKLSLKLQAYRAYAAASAGFGSAITGASFGTGSNLSSVSFSNPSNILKGLNTSVCVTGCDGTCHTGGVTTTSVVSGVSLFFNTVLTSWSPSTTSVVTSVGVSYSVVESSTAAGVSVVINGVDRTAALGGPFSADQVELDVLAFLTVGTLNTIALTPTGPGRIVGHLRLSGDASP